MGRRRPNRQAPPRMAPARLPLPQEAGNRPIGDVGRAPIWNKTSVPSVVLAKGTRTVLPKRGKNRTSLPVSRLGTRLAARTTEPLAVERLERTNSSVGRFHQPRLLGPPVRIHFPGTGKSYHTGVRPSSPQQRLAAAVSVRIFSASSAVAAPEAMRQRQLPPATPGTLIRASLPRPR